MDHKRHPHQANRMAFIDVGRGIAAGTVLLTHASFAQHPLISHGMEYWFNPGVFGVTLFFLISGFIIPASIEHGGLRRFWIARFFRLFPLYWLSIVLAVFLMALGAHINAHQFSAREILLNCTMLQEYLKVPHLLGLYWTLGLEMAFYLICSAMFATGLYRHTVSITWIIAIGLILIDLACIALHRSLPFGRIQLLIAAFVGTALYRVATGSVPLRSLLPLGAVLAISLTAAAWLRFSLYPGPSIQAHFFSFGCILSSWLSAYALFFALFVKRSRCFPAPLIWLGTVSYSVYLLHPLVLSLLPPGLPLVASSCAVILITVALAHYSYVFIEKPCIALGRNLMSWTPRPPYRHAARYPAIHGTPGGM
jgi:peptidoglycan/LPS O-acetylase OafA/YrhL